MVALPTLTLGSVQNRESVSSNDGQYPRFRARASRVVLRAQALVFSSTPELLNALNSPVNAQRKAAEQAFLQQQSWASRRPSAALGRARRGA